MSDFVEFSDTKGGRPSKLKQLYIVGYIWGLIMTIAFIITLTFCIKYKKNSNNNIYPIPKDQTLPVVQSIQDKITGGAGYANKYDHIPSKYFTEFDFLHNKPTNTLHILKNFKTYQQTTDYSCGPAAAVMALNYLGITGVSEKELSDKMDTGYPWHLNVHGLNGTTTTKMAEALRAYNVKVETNAGDVPPPWGEDFTKWIINAIDKNEVVLSKHIDWGGHWEVIIGYDDMGTEDTADDILIIADPYDSTDHRQDGYAIWSFERYYTLWGVNMTTQPLNEYFYQYVKISK